MRCSISETIESFCIDSDLEYKMKSLHLPGTLCDQKHNDRMSLNEFKSIIKAFSNTNIVATLKDIEVSENYVNTALLKIFLHQYGMDLKIDESENGYKLCLI